MYLCPALADMEHHINTFANIQQDTPTHVRNLHKAVEGKNEKHIGDTHINVNNLCAKLMCFQFCDRQPQTLTNLLLQFKRKTSLKQHST